MYSIGVRVTHALVSREELFAHFTPIPPLVSLYDSTERNVILFAGLQSGKTMGAVPEFMRRIYRDRAVLSGRLQYWIVAPTFPLSRRAERVLRDYALPRDLIEREFRGERIFELKGNITIQMKSADRPQSLVAEPVNGIWVDEAARMKENVWRENLEGRTTQTKGWHLFTSSSLGRNWFYYDVIRFAVEDHDPNYLFITWPTSANPHVDPAVIEDKRRKLPAQIFRREYEASLDAFLGQVYEEWSPAAHLVDEAAIRALYETRRVVEVRYGFDYGFHNPTALLAVIVDNGGCFWVADEFFASGKTWAEIGAAARAMEAEWGHGRLYYDPSKAEAVREFALHCSLPIVAANNDVVPGIQAVATLLHPVDGLGPRLRVVAKRCPNLIREFPLYRWDTNIRTGERPVQKDHDHALDALRYAVHTRGIGVV